MGNSPRYVGFIDPPYSPILTDDNGNPLDLTGCTGSSFTLTMVNVDNTPNTSAVCTGTCTTYADKTGKAFYQWALADVNIAGHFLLYVTVQLPNEPGPREFDPDPLTILAGTVGIGNIPPGVIPGPVINVRNYGALGNGTANDSVPFKNAIAAATS